MKGVKYDETWICGASGAEWTIFAPHRSSSQLLIILQPLFGLYLNILEGMEGETRKYNHGAIKEQMME